MIKVKLKGKPFNIFVICQSHFIWQAKEQAVIRLVCVSDVSHCLLPPRQPHCKHVSVFMLTQCKEVYLKYSSHLYVTMFTASMSISVRKINVFHISSLQTFSSLTFDLQQTTLRVSMSTGLNNYTVLISIPCKQVYIFYDNCL